MIQLERAVFRPLYRSSIWSACRSQKSMASDLPLRMDQSRSGTNRWLR